MEKVEENKEKIISDLKNRLQSYAFLDVYYVYYDILLDISLEIFNQLNFLECPKTVTNLTIDEVVDIMP